MSTLLMSLSHPVTVGVIAGPVVGKPVGVWLTAFVPANSHARDSTTTSFGATRSALRNAAYGRIHPAETEDADRDGVPGVYQARQAELAE